jgi:hypothetical protein
MLLEMLLAAAAATAGYTGNTAQEDAKAGLSHAHTEKATLSVTLREVPQPRVLMHPADLLVLGVCNPQHA